MKSDATLWINPFLNKALLIIDRWALFLLIVLAVFAILPGLGETSLLDWDESIYAQVAKEMIQSGDWINLHHGYQPYFEKPPLLMWGIGLSYKLLGVNEFSARLPSAISGILLIPIIYLIGKTLYGHRTGVLAGLILLSSFGFMYQSRNGTTNMPLTFFVFLGIFAYLRLRNGSPKWWYLFFTASALAFMMKFWAGLALPAVVFLTVLINGKLREILRTNHFWFGLLISILIVLPWHVLAYSQSGQVFVDAYITRNLVQRTLTPLEGHTGSTLYYLDVMRDYFAPWFFLIPFALALSVKEIVNQQRRSDILVVLIVSTVGLYTFVVNTKLPIYILPVFPALAILTAQLFRLDGSSSQSNHSPYLVVASLIATLVAQNKLLLLFILVGLALVLVLKTRIVSNEQMPQVIASLIFVEFVLIGTIGYIQGNNRLSIWPIYGIPDQPISQIATLARQNNPSKDDPLIGYDPQDENRLPNSAVEGPAATFYSNRPVLVSKSWKGLIELMNIQGTGEILIAENYLEPLSMDFDVTVIETVYPLVYARFRQ